MNQLLYTGCLTSLALFSACASGRPDRGESPYYQTLGASGADHAMEPADPAPMRSAAVPAASVKESADTTTSAIPASSGTASGTEPQPQSRTAGDHLGFREGDWDFQILGSGGSDKHWDSGNGSISAQLGYLVTDHLELAIRQSVVGFDAPGVESTTVGVTQLAMDYHFGDGAFVPFIGVNAGRVYGETDDHWTGAPEVGVKWFVKRDAYVMAMAEYEFGFDNLSGIDDAWEDGGAFVYTLGIGLRF